MQKVTFALSSDPGLSDLWGYVPSKYFRIYMQEFLLGTRLAEYDSTEIGSRLNA